MAKAKAKPIEVGKRPGGRPREHDRDKIALDLIEWAKKDDSINVNKFCAHYDPPFSVRKLSEWSKEDDRFRESYETAKTFLAYRREEWTSSERLHVKCYDLNSSAYDLVVREEKMFLAKFESSLKAQEQSAVSEADAKRFEDIMRQVKSLQSERKMARTTNKSDNKS